MSPEEEGKTAASGDDVNPGGGPPDWYASLDEWMSGNAETISETLGKLFERKTGLEPAKAEIYQTGQIEELFPDGPLLVSGDFDGVDVGPWHFLFPRSLSAVIADLIMNGKTEAEFDDTVHPETLGELWEQVMANWADEINVLTGEEVSASKPKSALEPTPFLKALSSWPVIKWKLTVEGIDESFFLQAVNPAIETLLQKSAVEAEPTVEASPQVESVGEEQTDAGTGSTAGTPVVQPASFQEFGDAPKGENESDSSRSIDMLLDINLPITIELGRTSMLIRDVVELGPGSVIELDKLSGEPVDLYINDRKFALGEVVVIDENFGIRITELLRVDERIKGLK